MLNFPEGTNFILGAIILTHLYSPPIPVFTPLVVNSPPSLYLRPWLSTAPHPYIYAPGCQQPPIPVFTPLIVNSPHPCIYAPNCQSLKLKSSDSLIKSQGRKIHDKYCMRKKSENYLENRLRINACFYQKFFF